MTFDEALTRLTQDMMAEQALQTHQEPRLLRFLGDAAAEEAIAFGFPRHTIAPITVALNDREKPIPSAVLSPTARLMRIEFASFDGFQLVASPRQSASIDNTWMDFIPGPPRYYYWTPENPGTISLRPKADRGGQLVIRGLYGYDRGASTTKTNQIWDGQHEAYHDIPVLGAAVKAYNASYEYEDAASLKARLDARRAEFTLFLQGSSAAMLSIGGQG